jgi:CRP-like cAMP-binding protein
MASHPIVETLRFLRFLHDVSEEHLDRLAGVATVRDFKSGAVVFREGDRATCVYLVVAGKVSLEICAPSVGCKRILTTGPGEVLAWSALLDDARLTATARTMEDSQLVELDAHRLLALFDENPQLGYDFTRRTMHAITKRLSATRMQLLDVYGSDLPAAAHSTED